MARRWGANARRVVLILRDEGVRMLVARVFAKLSGMLSGGGASGPMLVSPDDAAAVDWTRGNAATSVVVESGPIDIAWISSPPGAESGGHQNLFRFIKFAERAGHRNTIYLYDQFDRSLADIKSMLAHNSAYPDLDAEIRRYDPAVGVDPGTQALFATGWETAYPAYRDGSPARRFYFVQDFEPYFYPVGSEYLLAENSYRFGFHGITAGRWLARKLASEYGMPTDPFDFAVDRSVYHMTNTGERDEVFFYARPVTPRRAFEFGLWALADFAALRPQTTINFAGWDVSAWDIPFKHRNLASLDISELNAVYNRCAAGLVLSLTNMSLLPLELMSSGVVPVMNDAPNNRLVSDSPYIEYVPPSPMAIARRMAEVMERDDLPQHALRMSETIGTVTWEDSGRQFISAFERAMRG